MKILPRPFALLGPYLIIFLWMVHQPKSSDRDDLVSCEINVTPIDGHAFKHHFGHSIDLNNLPNYSDQEVPKYIVHRNGNNNPVTNEGATLGRVLFYDKKLSIDNTISCASCHLQSHAFGDTAVVSRGVQGGKTARHSMRLVNTGYSAEHRFFWDERAPSLEVQTTMPIKDHHEFGFSGDQGRPSFDEFLEKVENIDYYQELFTLVYGDPTVTECRIQKALAQFVRSIQSFDSKYDEGFESAFDNFTKSERRGLELFSTFPKVEKKDTNGRIEIHRTGAGLGCIACHKPPGFDIIPDAGNNGIIGVANHPGLIDIDNTKPPTLRDVFGPGGDFNGPLMHNGSIHTIEEFIRGVTIFPYDQRNTKLGFFIPRNYATLNITEQEKNDLIHFLKTLTGSRVYSDERWSDPF